MTILSKMLSINNFKDYEMENILDLKEASDLILKFKKEGKKIGLCHGGFDLLHPGHVKHIESAKKLCDLLFISVTSDKFVNERKGSGRPIFPDKLRAYMLSNLRQVDYVVISDYNSGVDVINLLKPSFYIKGPDYIKKNTPTIKAERKAIREVGGEIRYTEDLKLSTTKIIKYINKIGPKKSFTSKQKSDIN